MNDRNHECYICGRDVRFRGDACSECRQHETAPWAVAMRRMQLSFERHTERVEAALAEVKAAGCLPEPGVTLDDLILERVRAGQSTVEIVTELENTRERKTSRATLYRKVRAARQVLDRWDTGSRK